MLSCVAALTLALGRSRVVSAGRTRSILADMDFPGAQDRRPAAVVRPRTFDDVRRALAVLAEHGEPVTTIGGGHGPRSVHDGVVCIDLRSIPAQAEFGAAAVRVNGSARVADLLGAVPDGARVLPVGVSPSPGMGLLTTGGIGALSRSLGLSIDWIRSLDLLLADGSRVRVGPGSDLWWAARGAAARIGIVESATFATHPLPQVYETHILTRAGVLPSWAALAPGLPREATLSWTMSPADDGLPLVLLDEVSTTPGAAGSASRVLGAEPVLAHREWRHPYREFARFCVPDVHPPGDARVRRSSLLLSAAGMQPLVGAIVEHLRAAPTPWCRIEVQQMGGAVADVEDSATAFHGRDAEYSLTAEAVGPASTEQARADWLAALDALVAPAVVGRYMSDIQWDGCDPLQLEQGFGEQLARLRAVAEAYDPDARFRFAPPFSVGPWQVRARRASVDM